MPDRATGRLDASQRELVDWNMARGDYVMERLLERFLKGCSTCTCWSQEVMSPSPVRPGTNHMPMVCHFTNAGTPTAQAVSIQEQRIRGKAMIRASLHVKERDWTMHGESFI